MKSATSLFPRSKSHRFPHASAARPFIAAVLLLLGACHAKSVTQDAGALAADGGFVGAACAEDTECKGSTASCLTATSGFPEGYCTAPCGTDGGSCAGSSECVSGLFTDSHGNPLSVCLQSCSATSDCRSGYNCLAGASGSFCWPYCTSNTDCIESGNVCDSSTGLCSPGDAGPAMVPDAGDVVAVPLTGCALVGYSAQVKIGGSMTFAMSIDTGSTTMGIAAESCSNCDVSPEYTPGATAADTGMQTSSQYGSGAWSGEVYEDTVEIIPEMPAVPLYFAAIERQEHFFLGSNCAGGSGDTSQGILGMGPIYLDTIGTNPTDAYFPELVVTASLPNVFAVQLCNLNGTMWLGGFDASRLTAPPQYTPIVPLNSTTQPFYAVNLVDVGLDGVSLGATDYGPSVVDTGTYGFLMPADAYQNLVTTVTASPGGAQVFGSGKLTSSFFSMGNCLTPMSGMTAEQIDAALPVLSMTFPTAEGGSFIVQMPATESYLIPVGTGAQACYVAGAASSGMEGQTIIGASTQSSHMTIFDPAHNQVGFAPATGCP